MQHTFKGWNNKSSPSGNLKSYVHQERFTYHCSDISDWTKWCFLGRNRTRQDDHLSCSCQWQRPSRPPGWLLHKNGPFSRKSKMRSIKDMRMIPSKLYSTMSVCLEMNHWDSVFWSNASLAAQAKKCLNSDLRRGAFWCLNRLENLAYEQLLYW